jgi:hypothetical protein
VLGRPIRFQQISADAYRAGLVQNGMSAGWAQGLVDMAAAIGDGGYTADALAPTAPTGFRDWCEEVLKPAVLA